MVRIYLWVIGAVILPFQKSDSDITLENVPGEHAILSVEVPRDLQFNPDNFVSDALRRMIGNTANDALVVAMGFSGTQAKYNKEESIESFFDIHEGFPVKGSTKRTPNGTSLHIDAQGDISLRSFAVAAKLGTLALTELAVLGAAAR